MRRQTAAGQRYKLSDKIIPLRQWESYMAAGEQYLRKGLTNMAVLEITKENFQSEVFESSVPVLLDFWAAWCGPCRMVSPIVEEIANENDGFKVGKINVDEQPELAQQFRIMSIPTLVVIQDGKVVNKAVGARGKEDILSLIP